MLVCRSCTCAVIISTVHCIPHIVFQTLVKGLIGLQPGDDTTFLKREFQQFIAGLMSLPVKLPGTRLYRSLQAKKRMSRLLKKIIQEKRNRNRILGPTVNDVIDVLIGDTSGQLTDELISDNMIDLMIPAEDSVPVLITLAIKYLSDCPRALHKLQGYHSGPPKNRKPGGQTDTRNRGRVFGTGRAKEPAIKYPTKHEAARIRTQTRSLTLTGPAGDPSAVITETLRLGNIIGGIMRKAVRDVEVKGHFIPKGWCVFTYFRSVHLDESIYGEPLCFNPWRWKEKGMSTSNFTPFGGGQRLCPGLDLARLEASIFLHHFVTNFTQPPAHLWSQNS
ncbi:Cytochrome P450 90D2 [Platanthera guangdongensis]|uniref:Cytochrome P450 90D2 n=1 Tax=Platanthera guangdongensis TaxID=2320717 RepID=A0ABR2N0A2_9ASPA